MRVPCLFAAAITLVACAGRPPETPAQVADHEAAPTDEPSAKAQSSSPSASSEENRPAGDLVCRAVSKGGAATELFLAWEGNEASGVLRETAPSGMVHDKKVRAERHQGLVVADDINEKDLVVHAAVVAERNGKKVMKVEDAWSSCQ